MSEAAPARSWPGCGPRSLLGRRGRWSGRSRPATSAERSPRGAASSSGTSTSRRAATSRSRRTTTPRRTPRNHALGRRGARDAVDDLLDQPFGNWHVDTATETHQLRVTKKGEAVVHTRARAGRPACSPSATTTGDKNRLLAEDDPVFRALGLSDHEGRMKSSRHSKYRQVEEFLRILDTSIGDALAKGHLRTPTPEQSLEIVDLGCGNAYLTFVTERYLTHVRGLPVHLTGIDQRETSREHNAQIARDLGVEATFRRLARPSKGPSLPTHRPTSCSPCTPATRPPTTPWPGPSSGAPRWSWPRRAAITTSPHSSARRPRPRRTRCSRGTASCASGSPTPSPTACVPRSTGTRATASTSCSSSAAITPRATPCSGPSAPGGRSRVAPPARSTTSLVTTWGVRPRLGEKLLDA